MQQTPKIYIGLDGGGTATKAVSIDATGTVLATSTSGPSNPNNVGYEAAADNISIALRELEFTETTAEHTNLVLGIAGLANDEITSRLRATLLNAIPALGKAALHLTHDLEIAHYAAFRDQPGLLVVAGTGSACLAKLPSGDWQKASGRSETFDDPGSGYAISQNAIDLRLIVKPESTERNAIAALVLDVFALAEKGNPVARGILATEVQQLISLLEPISTAFTDSLPVALSGSILANENPFRSAFLNSLRERYPQLKIVEASQSPHFAAAEIAKNNFPGGSDALQS